MPYVNDYTCEELNKKFSDRSYQIIKKIWLIIEAGCHNEINNV
jgi:hypothetical protein